MFGTLSVKRSEEINIRFPSFESTPNKPDVKITKIKLKLKDIHSEDEGVNV